MTETPHGPGSAAREFDIVLFGATGFVGRLTAEHLASRAAPDVRVALAGRNRRRLESVRAGLTGAAADWPLIVVDAGDEAGLRAMAARTRVVVTTVGPYATHGLPLVRACAEAGTDYADLTGEVLFVRRSIDAADATARRTGARIVHSCGFDSIPSDLAVLRAAVHAHEHGLGELTDVTSHVRRMRGGFSGGTIASARTQLAEARADRAVARTMLDPHALDPADSARTDRRSSRSRFGVDDDGGWFGPFVMAGYNEPLVRRSNALTGGAYGARFRYREVTDTGRGRRGALRARALRRATPLAFAALSVPVLDPVWDRLLPAAGEGPSESARAAGRFLLEAVAGTTSGVTVRSRVGAELDPGYDGTAVMLGQAALALAAGEGDAGRGGVLTPSIALGESLASRLQAQGFDLGVTTG
ncbi:enoyl reductase [Tersicoccus solisilvae]|uniref:Enoyl reductase n=1 Tax=Tersicoccus solisilvae TaxID=1882339 RepID=A0ABQ1NRV9_9MICC|nr:saccharopine dehydrogenase NADP-binding domain-containing protein [Tersicoccus solisilvae]GGC82324.1 enoyl reductase [Tersicoccus solisilvae]